MVCKQFSYVKNIYYLTISSYRWLKILATFFFLLHFPNARIMILSNFHLFLARSLSFFPRLDISVFKRNMNVCKYLFMLGFILFGLFSRSWYFFESAELGHCCCCNGNIFFTILTEQVLFNCCFIKRSSNTMTSWFLRMYDLRQSYKFRISTQTCWLFG